MTSSMALWQAWGTPDLGTCGSFLMSLSQAVRKQLTSAEKEILPWTLYMVWLTQSRFREDKVPAYFSEAWLQERCGYSRPTVERAIAKYKRLGLLSVVNRPPACRCFRTNLYYLGTEFYRLLSGWAKKVLKNCRPSFLMDKDFSEKKDKTTGAEGGGFCRPDRKKARAPAPGPGLGGRPGPGAVRNEERLRGLEREYVQPQPLPQTCDHETARTGFASIYQSIAAALGKTVRNTEG